MNKKIFLYSIIFIVLLVFCQKAWATNVVLNFGGGHWDETPGSSQDTIFLQGGLSIIEPVFKNSALGIDYSIDYIGATRDIDENMYSSHISFIYRYYPDKNITRKTKVDTLHPFLSVAPAVIFLDNKNFTPGCEIQIGIDIVYRDFVLDPFSLISYPMTLLSNTNQLLSLTLNLGIFSNDGEYIFQKGIKIYTGTFF